MKKYLSMLLLSLTVSCTATILPGGLSTVFQREELHPLPYRTGQTYLSIYKDNAYKPFYIKGINMGVALPGKQPGELDIRKSQYLEWFSFLSRIGINTLRLYTLHGPQFYEALHDYNQNRANPLYVLHGIWLEESPVIVNENNLYNQQQMADSSLYNLYGSDNSFRESKEEVVDAVHGNKAIAPRFGKAHGIYRYDISKWVIGWIIGREVDPWEVKGTDEKNTSVKDFSGTHLEISGATGTEIFITRHLDQLIAYEKEKYKVERPVGFSSWPTLDPLTHPVESGYQDASSLDLAKIKKKNAPAGFFVSYHVYPNYPDFMSDSPELRGYSDRYGENSYLGYLSELKKRYQGIPLLINEFGISSSWGNAHFSSNGMHHGGHDEAEQGKYTARLLRNIYDTSCAGGALFNIIDEWWKRTWVVAPLSLPYERYKIWHNVVSPEQNYGLLAFKPETPPFTAMKQASSSGSLVKKVEATADAEFFHTRITFNSNLYGQEINIGYDTYGDTLGESVLPDKVKTSRRNEFALVIKDNNAQLNVTQAYDLYGTTAEYVGNTRDFADYLAAKEQLFHSVASDGAPWSPVRWISNRDYESKDKKYSFPRKVFELGKLRTSQQFPGSSLSYVNINQDSIEIKLPWTLLNFTDPSTLSVMNDDRSTKSVRETAFSEGIAISISAGGSLYETERMKWQGWENVPRTTSREKDSVKAVEAELKSLPDFFPENIKDF